MQSDNLIDIQDLQNPHHIQGPPQLPTLYKGQKVKSGPYTVTVTDEMVAQRERENLELYKDWMREQRRRDMLPEEDADGYIGDFKEAAIRRVFVRKVFFILTLQLSFTVAMIAIFMFIEAARRFMITYWYLWIIALVVFIISYCAISLSVNARRRPPFNIILLILLTFTISYLAAFVSAFYEIEVILIVMGMTAVVVFIIALIATFSKFDLTMRSGVLMVIGLVAIVTIFTLLIIMIFARIMVLRLVIAIIATLLLCLYLYFDIQTIMGGHRIELSPDEVVFASVQIYVDIILLYQYLLMFVGFFQR
ncbi:hypothetical protein HN011_007635 [Eciton burchellii]|nr:hypothetical protein HN011_007635 [Eciton burchellii]